VSSAALRAIIRHEGRLDLLCCILDGGPLSASQLSSRTGKPPAAIKHWIASLESFDLLDVVADPGEGEPLYVVTLDEQPEWVREAVEEHHRRR
jgi:hypothetical protein